MQKKIENLRWKPMWVSHLGCTKGCLDYLNLDISDAWLFGATGHAFIINIYKVVCPGRKKEAACGTHLIQSDC